MPGTKRARARATSEELDVDVAYVKRNKKTGRPARNSAGRKSLPTDFVNPDDFIDDDSQDDFEETETRAPEKRRPWTSRKRRISPPRALSPAAPIVDLPVNDSLDSPRTPSSVPSELSMTFHVAPGHTGPFVVKLDLSSILHGSVNSKTSMNILSTQVISASSSCSTSRSSSVSSRTAPLPQVGFLDLPAELRNYVYRLIFVSPKPVNFYLPEDFGRCAAFLATSRQVHDEGVQILYGMNTFELEPQSRSRGAYYQKTWTEVRYKDCFRFLSTIGPANISLLRTLTITFEDHSIPFVDDDELRECLKLLARYSELKELRLAIHGKKMLKPSEYRFLDNLQAIRADEVKIISRPGCTGYRRSYGPYWARKTANVQGDLDKKLVERMQRKNKLY